MAVASAGVYGKELIELSHLANSLRRLESPIASASKRSRVCGSYVTVDLNVEAGRISAVGCEVQACILGRASAYLLTNIILGMNLNDLTAATEDFRRYLETGEAQLSGCVEKLVVFSTVRHLSQRRPSILMSWEAALFALTDRRTRAL